MFRFKCLERSLSGRRDATLFIYGQYCRFVRRLCHRAVLPKCIPSDTDWNGLLQLCPDDLRLLSSRNFLNRLKLTCDLDQACQAKLERSRGESPASANQDELVTKERETFGTEARTYIFSLLGSLLRDIHFSANIVHGMGSFDPHVLLTLPLEQASFCFNALYDSFRLRGWVDESSRGDCRNEYFEYPNIDFLIPIPAFRSRTRLFHLFRLCCLCITEEHQALPAIKFQDVDTSSSRCRLSAVVLPAQSYLTNCPGAVSVCTTEAALTNYKELEGQFSSGQLAGDPWAHVDVFGQTNFLKTLTTAFKNLKRTPLVGTSTASRSSFVSTSAGRKINWAAGQAQNLAYFGDIPPSELSKTVQKLRKGSSKD